MRSLLKNLCKILTILLLLIFGSLAYATSSENIIEPGMSSEVFSLITYVLFALIFSFLCSIAEAVLLSITPSYIEAKKSERPKFAEILERLKIDDVDQSLAAILTLNTIAHTVGAIGAGAKATVVFGSAWFGLFSAVMTLMILFLSEIIPKTIGAVYWNKLVIPTTYFVKYLIVFLYPIVWISDRLTKIISQRKNINIFSRDEFIAMARVGEKSGQIQSEESRIIKNMFKFDSLTAEDIMTPRTVIFAFSEDLTIADSLKQVTETPFSRILIYKESLDYITGFVLKNDILIFASQNKGDKKLKTIKREIMIASEFISLTNLFERFLRTRQHIALVVDEYGVTSGLVTLEDLIETLTGMEIMDETDNVQDMRLLAREQWLKRAKSMGIEADIKKEP